MSDRNSPEYRSWTAMRTRCLNPNSCVVKAFDGCTCGPGQCHSYAVKLAGIEQAFRVRQAKLRAERMVLRLIAAAVLIGAVCAIVNEISNLDHQYQLEARR